MEKHCPAIAGVSILYLFLFGCSDNSKDLNLQTFESLRRAAIATQGAVEVGTNRGNLTSRVQDFASEVLLIKPHIESDKEKIIYNNYLNALTVYKASLEAWQLRNKYEGWDYYSLSEKKRVAPNTSEDDLSNISGAVFSGYMPHGGILEEAKVCGVEIFNQTNWGMTFISLDAMQTFWSYAGQKLNENETLFTQD